jgi:hypothetical protein
VRNIEGVHFCIKPRDTIEKIKVSDTAITEKIKIANYFNKFFSEISVKISDLVEGSVIPEDYLRESCENVMHLKFGIFTQAKFINIINTLEPKSSSDINGISNKMIKFIKFEIDKPLIHLFNLSLRNGTFPSQLKTCRTMPIFKSGDASLFDNYRPILFVIINF